MRLFAATLALLAFAAAALPAGAQNPQRCSREAFPVNGQPIEVTVCAGTPSGRSLSVSETFSRAGKTFTRAVALDVLPGSAVSRAVDDASLTTFGLPYTLHLTLAYRAGAASIEHALLLPGAVPLK